MLKTSPALGEAGVLRPVPATAPTLEPAASRSQSAMERAALVFACILVFVRFSMLHQLLTFIIGINTYLLYIFGIPAIVGMLAVGGLRRSLSYAPAKWWLAFSLWGMVGVPFSIWRGGSFDQMWRFMRSELVMLFIIAGVVMTWRDIRRMLLVISAAGFVSLLASRMFSQVTENERFGLEFGTVANANDFAAHLLLVLPFLSWVALSGMPVVIRMLAVGGIGYGTYVVLASGSRGALLALAVDIIFFTLNSTWRQRLALWTIGPIILTAAFLTLPGKIVNRLLSFSESSANSSEEAIASSDARQQLLRESIVCTLQHPVFGIGPGQFTTYQGSKRELRGTALYWRAAHNSFAQAASETGIPGFIFYVGGVFSTMSLLKKAYRRVRDMRRLHEFRNALFCMRLGLVGFCTAIFFLNFTFAFYLPAMAGLAIACWRFANTTPSATLAHSRAWISAD